ncbi:MAG: DUF134 domain-containing protein [Dissulfurimicrobium sp.]|uniref:DUF134 domain-containing protein n=1 Tax=Dissulfurimicrobium sp. TaxID=2022436 RepID=UPI00404B6812
MPRPPKCRIVNQEPLVVYFKPCGIPMRNLKEVVLSVDGFEAIRLTDLEGLDQEAAAAKMGISRQTFGRILAMARKAMAEAIVFGLCLRIEGGNYQLSKGVGDDTVKACNIYDKEDLTS